MDTIPDREQAFKLIRYWHAKRHDVIFEGVIYSDEFGRTAKLAEDGIPLLVISLTTPLEICLKRINARRREKKPDAPDGNPHTTTVRVARIQRTVERLDEAGVRTSLCSNAEASVLIRETLGLPLEA